MALVVVSLLVGLAGAGMGARAAASAVWTAVTLVPEPDEITEVRADLYGLHAVLQLHNAQEEENAFSLMGG